MRMGAYAGVSLGAAVATVLHAWQTRCSQSYRFTLYANLYINMLVRVLKRYED